MKTSIRGRTRALIKVASAALLQVLFVSPALAADGFVGCYTDQTNSRALPTMLMGSGATVESCIAAAAAQSFVYAGLQFGGECWAGNALAYTRVDNASCNMPCTANTAEVCGGSSLNSVYATTIDMGETAEVQFTSATAADLAAKAAALGSPVAIYEYVSNEAEYALYHGARSGSVNSFMGARGNDVDLAATLIAMLRSRGIPARYAVGTARISSIKVANWLGVKNVDLAYSILRDQGIQGVVMSADKSYIDMEHVWVEALVPYALYRGAGPPTANCATNRSSCNWVSLDPSFKQHDTRSSGLDPFSSLSFDYTAYYNALKNNDPARRDKNPLEIYENQILDWLQTSAPGRTLDDIPDVLGVMQQTAGLLPASLPYVVTGTVRRYSSVAAHDAGVPSQEPKKWGKTLSLQIAFTATISGGGTVNIQAGAGPVLLTQLATQRLTLTTEINGSIPEMVVRLGGTEIARPIRGGGTIVGYTPTIGDPFSIAVYMDGAPGADSTKTDQTISATYSAIIGGYYLLASGGETSNWSQVHRAAQDLLAANAQYKIVFNPSESGCQADGTNCTPYVDANGNGWDSSDPKLLDNKSALDALTGGLLYVAATQYYAKVRDEFARADALNKVKTPIAGFLGVVSTTYGVEYVSGTAFSVLPGGLLIDMKGITIRGCWRIDQPATFSNSQFQFLGHLVSSLEHETWQELIGYDAISTVRGIQMALASGATLLNPKKNQTTDTVAAAYPAFGFTVGEAPSGFTYTPFSLFGTRPATWTHATSGSTFDLMLSQESTSTATLRRNRTSYLYSTSQGLYPWVKCANDQLTQLNSYIAQGQGSSYATLTFCDGGSAYDRISNLVTALQNDYLNSVIPNAIGTSYFAYFDGAQGFVPTSYIYRTSPAPSPAQFTSFVQWLRDDMYLRDLSQSWVEYYLPSQQSAGGNFKFAVDIRYEYDTPSGDLNAATYEIQNNTGVSAGGGYVPPGGQKITTAGSIKLGSGSVVPTFNNSTLTDKNTIAETNNDKVKTASTADPVSTVTGNNFHDETDFLIKGRGIDYTFTRTYNSAPSSTAVSGPLGYGWTHSYAMRLKSNDYGACPNCSSAQAAENGSGKTSSVTYTDERGGEHNYLVNENTAQDYGIVVATGNFLAATMSPGGTTWTAHPLHDSFEAVASNGSVFVTVGEDVAAISSDGVTWTSVAIPAGGYRALAWNGSVFVAVGDNVAAMSPDGKVWTSSSIPANQWYGVAWSGRVFVAVGEEYMAYSPDGMSWTLCSQTFPYGMLLAVTWTGSAFVAVGSNGPGMALVSPDGLTWAYYAMPRGYFYAIAWNGSVLVAVGDNNNLVAISRDGTDWHTYTIPPGPYYGIVWDGAQFVAVGVSCAATSPDGQTWTPQTLPPGYYSVFTGVAVGRVSIPPQVSPPQGEFDSLAFDTPVVGQHTIAFRNGVKYVFEGPSSIKTTPGVTARLKQIADPWGNQLNFAYDGNGRLSTVTDNLGISGRTGLTFAYDGSGHLSTIRDWASRTWTYSVNSGGDLATYTNPLNQVLTYTYGPGAHNLHELVKPLQRNGTSVRTAFTYYLNGRTFNYANSLGNTETLDYDLFRRTTRVTDPRGGIRQYEYDDSGRLTRLVEPDGAVLRFDNTTTDGLRYKKSDGLGYVTQYSYRKDKAFSGLSDTGGNVTRERDALSQTVDTTYGPYDQVATMTDKRSTTRTTSFHGTTDSSCAVNGKPNTVSVSVLSGVSNVSLAAYCWNSDGTVKNQTEYVVPESTRWRTSTVNYETAVHLNVQNIVLSGSDGSTLTKSFTYDSLGRKKTETLARRTSPTNPALMNLTTTFTYDALDRVTLVEDAIGNRIETVYDANGQVYQIIGHYKQTDGTYIDRTISTRAYDAADRMFQDTDVYGHTTSYGYDESGNVLSVTDANGHATHYEYDEMNRRTAVIDANGNRTETTYDLAGHVRTVKNANGEAVTNQYDALGRVTQVTDAKGFVTTFSYDGNGNRTCTVDGNAQAGLQPKNAHGCSEYVVYDELDRAVTVEDARNGQTVKTYDLLGNVTSIKDAENHTTTMVYDDLGRLVRTVDPLGKATVVVEDEAGNAYQVTNRVGQVTQITYDALNRPTNVAYLTDGTTETMKYDAYGNEHTIGNGVVTYTFDYDLKNRLKTKTDSRSGKQLAFEYDAAGNLVTKTDYQGDQTTFQYDFTNRLVAMTNRAYLSGRYQYDPAGRLLTRTLSDGARSEYTWDANGWLATLRMITANGTVLSNASYTRDRVGNITAQADGYGAGAYVYDGLYRLTSASYPGAGVETYTYDRVGNRQIHDDGTAHYYGSPQLQMGSSR